MAKTTKPSKQAVREYMKRPKAPPLSPEEVRRRLGWEMIQDKPKMKDDR